MEDGTRVRFIRPGRSGIIAVGYEATILIDICDAVLEARKQSKEKLTPKQLLIAEQCEILARSFAKVGIIALVDEVTGYQQARDRDALQKILEKFIAKELQPWVKTFPDEYYEHLFRLKRWDYKPLNVKRLGVVGHYTNDLIYERLAPGILDELKKDNPKTRRGNRKHKHFQHLSPETGHPKLREHISSVMILMKVNDDWDAFYKMLEKGLPKYIGRVQQLNLPLDEIG